MLSIIPALVLVTITLTLILLAEGDRRDLSMTGPVARDMAQVHEWRAEQAESLGMVSGEITGYPGYPFDPFFDYRSYVFTNDGLNVTITWPEDFDAIFDPDQAAEMNVLKRLEGTPDRRVYAGLYREEGSIGFVSNIEVPDIGVTIPENVPVILNVTAIGGAP